MFEHSIKVPRHFKISANIVKKVVTEGGSVKNLLYDSKLKFFRTNVIYALITETIKHAGDIDKLFEATGILTNEPRLDPWLAKVITTELLFGKKELPGHSKPEKTILSYKEKFEKVPLPQVEVKFEVRRPRYVRINTNLLTTSDAIGAFQDEGYKFIRCTSGSYDDFLKQIQSLSEYDFTQDFHVKTMFVFHPSTKFYDYDLYLENKIILQDKATALPVHLLAPPQGSVVLDMCAAPGMKTTQLAAYMRNQGKIYAVERNEQRYQTLCDFVQKTESKCVTTMHRDSLDIKRGECDDVEYIILDPSCSGSGMQLSVHNYVEDVRLARLTSLQEKFLKHAMNSFPKAKKIVYSTCSLFPQENERVISNVVKLSRAKWKVLNVKELLKGHWNNFGSGMYGEMGTRCLYAKPDSDLTTGFFLAVLERDPKQSEKTTDAQAENNDNIKKNTKIKSNNEEVASDINSKDELKEQPYEEGAAILKDRKNKKKSKELADELQDIAKPEEREVISKEEDESNNPKRKKKSKKHANSESGGVLDNSEEDSKTNIENVVALKKSKKKKKKGQDEDRLLEVSNTNDCESIMTIEEDLQDSSTVKKKKKKRKIKELNSEETNDKFIEHSDNVIETAIKDEDDIFVTKKKEKKLKHHEKTEFKDETDNSEPVNKKKKKRKREQ